MFSTPILVAQSVPLNTTKDMPAGVEKKNRYANILPSVMMSWCSVCTIADALN